MLIGPAGRKGMVAAVRVGVLERVIAVGALLAHAAAARLQTLWGCAPSTVAVGTIARGDIQLLGGRSNT